MAPEQVELADATKIVKPVHKQTPLFLIPNLPLKLVQVSGSGMSTRAC